MQCDALILGGGLGSRMGYKNKALVNFHGQYLFAHVLKTLQSLNLEGRIYLSLNQDLEVVAKLYPELELFSDDADLQQKGPLGGLLSFYRHYKEQSQRVFVCPCDTPFISRELLVKLYQSFTSGADSGLEPDYNVATLNHDASSSSSPSFLVDATSSTLEANSTQDVTSPHATPLVQDATLTQDKDSNQESPALVCAASSHGLEPSIMLAKTSEFGVIATMIANHEKLSLRNLFTKLDGKSVYFASTQDFYNINTLRELEK